MTLIASATPIRDHTCILFFYHGPYCRDIGHAFYSGLLIYVRGYQISLTAWGRDLKITKAGATFISQKFWIYHFSYKKTNERGYTDSCTTSSRGSLRNKLISGARQPRERNQLKGHWSRSGRWFGKETR